DFGTPGVIILLRDRVGLETGDELLRVIVLAAGHPAGGLDTTAKHIVVGILFVVRPGILAEYSIDLKRANEKNEAADQLVARNVAHAVIVVLQAEVTGKPERARLLVDFALIAQDVIADGPRLTDIVTHVVVGGADHVAGVALGNELGHRAGADESDVIGVRLDGGEHLSFVG